MKKIETKIAKNGTKMYYVDGKRVNREDAIETASMTRETPFTIEYTAYDTKIGEVVDKVITTDNLQITIQPIAHKYDMGYHVLVRSEQIACKFGYKNDEEAVRLAKKNANATVDAIVEAYVTGAAGVKLAGNIVAVIRNEAYPDEYAVSDEALEVAINAEIELAKEAEREEIISNPLITEDAFEEAYYGELMNAYNAEINPKKEAYYQALTEALLLKFTLEEFETAMLDTAVTAEAFEIAVDAECKLANKVSKTAKKNYSINPVIGEDDNMKLNHVDIYTKGNKVEISSCFECKKIETAYRRFRKIMIQIDADHPELQLGGENDWLPANKITLVSTGEKYEEHFCGYNENDDMIFSASPVEALAVDINEDWFYFYGTFTIENIKEETQMTIEIPAEGKHEFTIGDDTVTFFNGKFRSVFSAKYHMAIIRDLVGCRSYCIFDDDDTKVHNVREHETSYDNFMEILHQRGSEPPPAEKQIVIEAQLTENGRLICKCNGKRESLGDIVATCQCSINNVVIVNENGDKIICNNRYYRTAEGIINEIREHVAKTQMPTANIIEILCDKTVDELAKNKLVEDLRLASPDYRAKVVAAMITEKSVLKEQIESLKARFNEIQAEMIQANKTSGATFDWETNRAEYHSNNQTALALLRRVNRLGYTLKQLGVGYPEQDAPLAIVANEKDYYKESVELADKIRRDAQPCDDNDDVFNLIPNVDAFDDEQPTTRDKYWQARAWLNRTISKGKEYWFLFGRRVKKNSVDVAAYLYDYGLTPDKFAVEDQKVIDEEQRETAIRWANWQKEWFAEYLADKIKRDSKSYDDSDVVFKLTPDDDDDDDELIDPPVDNTLTADIAKYQDAFEKARQISIRAGSGVCKINGEEIWFNYGNLRSISSDRYRAEITFNNGRKRFRYRGIVIKRADFLDAMNNEIVAAEQKEIFGEFYDDYQMPDTELDPNADYFQIRIFPKFANGTESSFHATANDFNRALELINQFKTLDLPFIGLIKRNTVCGEEYYRHNRDGSEVINPPQPKLPDNIKDSLQRAMKAALEQYRRYNLNHNQAGANRERECFLICKKALKEVA